MDQGENIEVSCLFLQTSFVVHAIITVVLAYILCALNNITWSEIWPVNIFKYLKKIVDLKLKN